MNQDIDTAVTITTAVADSRGDYERPQLRDLGDLNALTETGFVVPGADGIYS